MATEQLDPRELLAKLTAERNEVLEKARKAEEDFEEKSKALLAQLRDVDLDDVRTKCRLHGFTATELRGYLKTKGGGGKTAARKSAAGQGAPRRKKAAS